MSKAHISKALRERVAIQAKFRCGYCLTAEAIVGCPMEIEHIIPESQGGPTEEDNLWLACSLCNDIRGSRMLALDPASGELVRLFNPRHQSWSEHFTWSNEGYRIIGRTAVGRATVVLFNLNRQLLVTARQAWVAVGWHPPKD